MDAVREFDELIDQGARVTWLEQALYNELASVELAHQQEIADYVKAQSKLLDMVTSQQRVLKILGGMLKDTYDVLAEISAGECSTMSDHDILEHMLDVAQAIQEYEGDDNV